MGRGDQKNGLRGRALFINFKSKDHSIQTTSKDGVPESAPKKALSPETSENPVPAKKFQFIDNSSASSTSGSSTQVRRHVMQEFMRQKRWQDKKRQENIPTATDANRRFPGQKLKAQKGGNPPDSVASTDASSPGLSMPSASGSSQLQPLVFADSQQEAWNDEQVEDIHRYDRSVEPTKRGQSDFFFLEPSAFAQLADLSPDDSSCTGSVGSSDCFSSAGSPGSSEGSPSFDYPDPQTTLSAARSDPFDCLPLKLGYQDQELFDFYANVMPACSYGFERRSPHAHNWYLTVFVPEAMKGAVAFQNTVLVHAASTQAWVKGLKETRASLEHRALASHMLLQNLQNLSTDASDASISATLSAAALEDFDPRLERREYAWMHFRAAVQMIRDRGGPAALWQQHRLQMLINWSDYIFSGYSSVGPTFFFFHTASSTPPNNAQPHWTAVQEIREQCEEFIKFYGAPSI